MYLWVYLCVTHTYASELNNILGGCSPHVDFENKEDSGCNINTNTHIRTLTQLTYCIGYFRNPTHDMANWVSGWWGTQKAKAF